MNDGGFADGGAYENGGWRAAPSREVMEELVRAFWQARFANAAADVERLTTDDVVFRMLGIAPLLPGRTVFEGQAEFLDALGQIGGSLEFLSVEIADLIIDGAHAALRWHAKLMNRRTGVDGEIAVFDLIAVRDGKIARYEEFLDTDGFMKLMIGEPQPRFSRRANRARRGLHDILRDARTVRDPTLSPSERDAREARLLAAFADRQARGGRSVADHWIDACEFHVVGDLTVIPFARSHFGADAVRALIDQIDREVETFDIVIHRIVMGGLAAAMHWSAGFRHRGTSAQGRTELLSHIVMEGDRIASITDFFDTSIAAQLIQG